MVKIVQTLLTNRVLKKGGEPYKKEEEVNNLASPKNGFVPGDDASHADVPSQPPSELGPAAPPQIKISSQPVALEETPIWRNEQRGFLQPVSWQFPALPAFF